MRLFVRKYNLKFTTDCFFHLLRPQRLAFSSMVVMDDPSTKFTLGEG